MDHPTKYRKKPVIIDAWQYTGTNSAQIMQWVCSNGHSAIEANDELRIDTLEGTMVVSPTDWVICGVAGEFYPCKNSIFQQTYEVNNG
jgi:hypothetical protein